MRRPGDWGGLPKWRQRILENVSTISITATGNATLTGMIFYIDVRG